VTFTDRATWSAAATGASNIDFEGIAPVSSYTGFTTPAGLTLSSVNFVSYNLTTPALDPAYLYVIDPLYHPNTVPPNPVGTPLYPYDRGTGASVQGPNADPDFNGGTPGAGILVTLPGVGNTAIGADFWAFFFEKSMVPTATFEVTYLNGAVNLGTRTFQTVTYPGVQFFGVTSDTPITQMFVTSLGGTFAKSSYIQLDNFAFGTAAVTTPVESAPEPSTFFLLSGAVASGLFMRRRRA
jgi:hypothetical protein